MNMPGFTAEASLFNGDVRYQATTAATAYSGVIQPAISDVLNLNESGLNSSLFSRFNCLKRVCSFGIDDFGLPVYKCRRVSAIC